MLSEPLLIAGSDVAREDFYYFSRWMFLHQHGYKWVKAEHHRIICDALMRVYRGECTRLIINIPPRYSKTLLCVINLIAWTLGRHPDSEYIHTSYSGRLATNNSWQTRGMVQHEMYQRIFPEVQLCDDSKAKDEWRTTDGGCMYAVGAGGTITGYGAGKHRDGFGGCFPYEQLVETEIGQIAIGDIVTKRLPIKVWSWNESTAKVELQPIDTFWTNPSSEILEIGMPSGSAFRCTPNHKILTSVGWIEASSLVAPGSIGKVFSNTSPRLAEFDLTDNTTANTVHTCQFCGFEFAGENYDNLIACELCSRPPLHKRECSMSDGILHIVGFGSPRQIVQHVVSAVSIKMTRFIKWVARTYKSLKHKMCNITHGDFAINGKVDAEISLSILAGLKQASGIAPHIAMRGNCIQPISISYVKPSFIRRVGHVEHTFCLEVRGNNNFILSQSCVIVKNCIIVDDPHKADEARSDVMRQNVIDWFQNTLESRKNSPHTPIILIMQRLHENDLSGWLLEGHNGEEWEHVCLPALRDDGTALWPEKHDAETLRRMMDSAPYTFAGQYQQRPAPPEGNLFKPDNIPIVDALYEYMHYVRAWDLASTAGGGDWTVGFKLGVDYEGGRITIADIVRLRGSPEEVENAIKNTAVRDGRECAIHLPQDPGQAGKSQIAYLTKQLMGFTIQSATVSGDKITRAEPFASQCNVGNVSMLRAPWNDSLINEMRMFPNGANDDQIDAGSLAFQAITAMSHGVAEIIPIGRMAQSDW